MARFDLFRFFSKEEPSKDIARERLKLVVLYDRAGMTNQTLEKIKLEIGECLARYLVVDEPGLDVQLLNAERRAASQSGSQLVVNVPIKQVLDD